MKNIFFFLLISTLILSTNTLYAQKDLIIVNHLQNFKREEIPSKYQELIATEGRDFSKTKKLYTQNLHIFSWYGGDIAYIKVNNKVHALKLIKHNPGKKSFTSTFSNSFFKLIIKCFQIKDIPDYPMEGWSEYRGNIELYDNRGNRIELVQGFYGEGI